MSNNILDAYIANALTTLASDDLVYIGDDPGGDPEDGAISYGDLIAQIKGTEIGGARLEWVSVSAYTVHESAPFLAENGDVLEITSAIATTGLTTLTVSSWYHIYSYLSGGVAVVETVLTAPVAWKGTAYSKTGDTSRRYIGSILTDSAGDIIAFEHTGNRIIYKLFKQNDAIFRILNGGTSTSAASASASGAIPLTARLANVRILNTADGQARTSEDNSVSTNQSTTILNDGDVASNQMTLDHALDSSLNIWYYIVSLTTGGLFIDVVGYVFDR